MKCIIWDFDGTLGYRHGGMWTVTVQEMLAEQGLPAADAEMIRAILREGFPWRQPEVPHPHLSDADQWWDSVFPTIAKAFESGGASASRAGELACAFRPRYLDLSRWRLFDDTLPVLVQLAAAGWTHLLLSNHVPELPAILDHLGLTAHFAGIFNSAAIGYEKPNAEAFRCVLRTVPAALRVWMVGDNFDADIVGAAAANVPSILVRTTHPDSPRTAPNLHAVAEILHRASPHPQISS